MYGHGWKVGELARETGLSVRTLHYYEQIGLLKPSARTESGHRLYSAGDIARLQQIASLRQLGFTLEQIADCLNGRGMTPLRVVELHLARLDEQIEVQQRLRDHLKEIATALRASASVSVDQLIRTIEETKRVESYYTPEQLKQLEERRQQYGDEQIRGFEQEWADLIAAVQAEMDRGTEPSDPRVLELARKWMGLVEAFTGGDPGISASLKKMWETETQIHGLDTAAMRMRMEYIQRALASSPR